MSCDRYATAIADHACGADLTPDAAAHLGTCAACAAKLADQQRAMDGLDADIRQLVAIEPSPFFVERVRAGVSTPPGRSWLRIWGWSAAAAAAVLLIGVLLLTGDRQQPSPAPVRAEATPPRQPPVVDDRTTAVENGKKSPAPARRTVPEPARAKGPAAIPTEPEVLVPQDQMRAVQRYLALMRSGRLDTSRLVETAADDPAPAELVVDPLAIAPLAVTDIDSSTPPSSNDGSNRSDSNA